MSAITYKCPNCGGGLVFDPKKQKYSCDYCQSDFEPQDIEKKEETLEEEKAAGRSAERSEGEPKAQALLYNCPSCGAEIVTDETTAATFCYYCHNPVVLAGKLEGDYRPDYVIPFQIDRDQARKIFTQWIRRKRYVPSAFYSPKQIETMTGVYFPYWMFGCKAKSHIQGEGIRTRSWTTGSMQYTENKVYAVEREGTVEVDHVVRNALKKANRRLVDSVQPFDPKDLKEFSMGYLSGFVAENRDMEKKEFEAEVEQEVSEFALSSVQGDSGYSSLKLSRQETTLEDKQWNYALLPVWTLTYREKEAGKIYYFAINGQSGKVCGQLPVDKMKLVRLFGMIFVPLFLILLAGGYLL